MRVASVVLGLLAPAAGYVPAGLAPSRAAADVHTHPAVFPRKAHCHLPPQWPRDNPPPRECVINLQRATAYLRHEEATIIDALSFATNAHAGQKRKSGEPFIIHPIETACILAELGMDCDTVVAGLLHDTVEDTSVTVEDIRERFGDSVAAIVSGVTDGAAMADEHNQQELLLAMSQDWRIVLVKLADRLHNMRTLQHMPVVKQQRKARETIEFYVPLARRMGVAELEQELLLQGTRYLFPRVSAHLRPVAYMLGRLGTTNHLISSDMEVALSNHRQAWAAHKAEMACSY